MWPAQRRQGTWRLALGATARVGGWGGCGTQPIPPLGAGHARTTALHTCCLLRQHSSTVEVHEAPAPHK